MENIGDGEHFVRILSCTYYYMSISHTLFLSADGSRLENHKQGAEDPILHVLIYRERNANY